MPLIDPTSQAPLDDCLRTPCEVWSRVMGYHRPVSAFNVGKQREHRDRQPFSETPTHRSDHT